MTEQLDPRPAPCGSAPRSSRVARLAALALGAAALAGVTAGCRPTRMLVIESVPPGAIVRLDETVIGRTPLEHPFGHYGERRLSLYMPGYRTHSERIRIAAPWHARFPWDLFTEVILPLGLEDRVVLAPVALEPDDGIEAIPAATEFVQRAGEVRDAARAAADERRARRGASGAGGTGVPGDSRNDATPAPAPAPAAPGDGAPLL